MNDLFRHQLAQAVRAFRNSGSPREWIHTALAGAAVGALLLAIYVLI